MVTLGHPFGGPFSLGLCSWLPPNNREFSVNELWIKSLGTIEGKKKKASEQR
jgi:hypothetical protein